MQAWTHLTHSNAEPLVQRSSNSSNHDASTYAAATLRRDSGCQGTHEVTARVLRAACGTRPGNDQRSTP
jgi:hypothetical protein